MEREKQIEEMVKIMNETCNVYDEQGNHVKNKCAECDCWSDDNHCCCSYNNKEATALYNAGYRKQEWISVEDRLPDEDGEYLTYDGIIYYLLDFNASLGLWNVSTDVSIAVTDVTHWMPLPTPPKMKGAE